MKAYGVGSGMISDERRRQVEEEGYDSVHDDYHKGAELAMAAIAYAAPVRIYVRTDYISGMAFRDPFPGKWKDKRMECGARAPSGVSIPDPMTYTKEERIGLLVKAGALIAAEIDRLMDGSNGAGE